MLRTCIGEVRFSLYLYHLSKDGGHLCGVGIVIARLTCLAAFKNVIHFVNEQSMRIREIHILARVGISSISDRKKYAEE